MEKLAHLWNVSQFMGNLKSDQARILQAHYINCCKSLVGEIELPKQQFGPSSMCSHCGVLWRYTDYKVRIIRGRKPSRFVKRLIRNANDNMPKVRTAFIEKCKRNTMNKLVRKCSLCLKNTEVPMEKPKREKCVNLKLNSTVKKKKNRKSKTAGLNIPGTSNLESTQKSESNVQSTSSAQKTLAKTPKPKKLNINYLKNVITQEKTPQKRKSLHNFLTELY